MCSNRDLWESPPMITIEYTWKDIPWDLMLEKQKSGDFIESPTFCADKYEDTKWRLVLSSEGIDNFVRLSITVKCESTEYLVANAPSRLILDISDCDILDSFRCDENGYSVEQIDGQFYSGFPLFVTLNDINHMSKRKSKINCRIDTRGPIFLCTTDWKLNDDIGQLLNSERFSDVKLNVKDQIFNAHKVILASRSPVFSAMFEHEMLENIQGLVTVDGVNERVFEEMLRYIYTGKTPNFKETVFDLLPAADKYQLDELKIMCEVYLCHNLTTENIMDIMVLADAHCSTKLKEKAIEFFNIYAKQFIDTEAYKSMRGSHPNLIAECFEALISNNE